MAITIGRIKIGSLASNLGGQWNITPATPTVTINSNTSLTVDWVITGLDKTVTAVELWHSTDGTTYTRLVKLGAVATYDHDGLENNSIHYYKVRYWSGVYVSGFSGVVYFNMANLVAGEAFDNGKIILQFDDAWDSVYDYGLPVFTEKEVKITTWANGSLVESQEPYLGFYQMTWEELNDLASRGHDIQCHGYTGANLTTLTDEQIADEYINNNNIFVTNGLQLPKHTSYSGSYCDYSTIQQTSIYRKTGRRGTNDKLLNRYGSKLMMSCGELSNSIDEIKNQIHEAYENKTAIVLYGHMIGVEDSLSMTVVKLEEIIDYGKSLGLDFITISELYDQLFYLSLNLYREGLDDDEIGIFWESKLDDSWSYSLERSIDGINFTEIYASNAGDKTYLDSGLSANTNYYYRIRAVKDTEYLAYSGIEYISTPVTLTLNAVGTGVGVSTFTFIPEYDTDLTVDGNAHFYTNSAGTEGESQSLSVYRGIVQTIYIKCTSGTSNFKFNTNYLKKWENWATASNSPSIGGNISIFKRIYYLVIAGLNSLTGNLSDFNGLNHLYLSADCSGITKNISTLTKLQYLRTVNSGSQVTGDLSDLIKLNYLNLNSGLDSVSGSISNLVLLTYFSIAGTSSNVGGSISNLTELTFIYLSGNNTLSGSFVLLTKLSGGINIGDNNSISGVLSDIADNVTSLVLGSGTTIGGSVDDLPENITTLTINGMDATVNGNTSQFPRSLKAITLIGNTVTGDIADLPSNLVSLTIKGSNTIYGDLASLPSSLTTFNIQNGQSAIASYTYPHSWAAMKLFYYYPYGVSISVTEASNLIIDISAATWSGLKLFYIQPTITFSMVDTTQGGIWGDFSGTPTPSTLATALKTLAKTKTVAVAIKSLTLPGATGDGTGFPAGFGDWYRS